MQSTWEYQGEIRKPEVNNAKNNRMGKTRDLVKKIGDTKGIFHAKTGSIKDRNSKDLTEAEDIKKRWQEYTEELYKNINDPDNHDGVITTEPDILECEIKWALGSMTTNKASGGDEMPDELFKILNNDDWLPCSSNGKESACDVGDQGLIPRSGRSSGEGNGNPLQYSFLENSMDREAWQATVCGVAKSQTWLSD